MKDEQLCENLKKWRMSVAKDENIPYYTVITNRMLSAILQSKPESPYELLNIEGMDEAKVEKYGNDILRIIKEYLANPIQEIDKDKYIENIAVISNNSWVTEKAQEDQKIVFLAVAMGFIDKLPDRKKRIILSRYQGNGNIKTLQEVGDEFGISRERVRQLEKRIIMRLKSLIKKNESTN